MLDPRNQLILPPFYTHVIRLAGPWQILTLEKGSACLHQDVFRMPGNFETIEISPSQGFRLRRFFRWLAVLEPTEEVDLILEGCSRELVARLGNSYLGKVAIEQRGIFPITPLLRSTNELFLDVAPVSDRPACVGKKAESPSADGIWAPPLLAIRLTNHSPA